MPELPEVETVRRGLEPAMTGQRILRADIRRPDLRWPFPPGLAQALTGRRVLALRRRSKYLLADLDSGQSLLVHLGMSGRMLISAPAAGDQPSTPSSGQPLGQFHHSHPAPQRHDHVVLDMDGGARITFNDARRFGAMDLLDTAQEAQHRLLAGLGPEPLGNGFDAPYLIAGFRGRAAPVKALLLDQGLVAGLGNIYVCEVLYRAGIDPRRPGASLSPDQVAALVPIIREVLHEAIAAGGSSLRDYRQAGGELGYFQHAFRVYGREGAPCLNPGCAGQIGRVVQSGRSSFYCPQCQK